jgi:hypothetical protein
LAGGRGRCGGGTVPTGAITGQNGTDATTLLGNRLHQPLELAKGHGETPFGLALSPHTERFHHDGEHPAVGLGGATGGNSHADSAPLKAA